MENIKWYTSGFDSIFLGRFETFTGFVYISLVLAGEKLFLYPDKLISLQTAFSFFVDFE